MSGQAQEPASGVELVVADPNVVAGTAHHAFPMLKTVPLGCTVWLVNRREHEPVLKPGEWAVIDTTDRKIEFGELYLVRQYSGPIVWHICQDGLARPDGGLPCAMLRPVAGRYRTNEEVDIALCTGRVYVSDGPIPLEYLQEQIIGRVIGVFREPA